MYRNHFHLANLDLTVLQITSGLPTGWQYLAFLTRRLTIAMLKSCQTNIRIWILQLWRVDKTLTNQHKHSNLATEAVRQAS